jgi:hypothetical protein
VRATSHGFVRWKHISSFNTFLFFLDLNAALFLLQGFSRNGSNTDICHPYQGEALNQICDFTNHPGSRAGEAVSFRGNNLDEDHQAP